jgi:hypothetical protein
VGSRNIAIKSRNFYEITINLVLNVIKTLRFWGALNLQRLFFPGAEHTKEIGGGTRFFAVCFDMELSIHEVSPRSLLIENGSEILLYMLRLTHLNVHA